VKRLVLQPAVRTDPGLRRSHNEDHVLGTPRMVAVADGVGGAVAGEVASGAAIGTLDPVAARRHPQRSVVLRALDGDPSRRAHIAGLSARVGDRLLLCSDGLSDVVEAESIVDALRLPSRDASADRLLALALGAGAPDNVSVVVADVVPAAGEVGLWRRPTETEIRQ
jgi:serine/threonine protein phosphatase PrpC